MLLAVGILGVGAVFLLLVPVVGAVKGIGAILALVALLAILKVATGAMAKKGVHFRKRERHAAQGAKGEDQIARILEKLPGEWAIFHDIPTGFGDIDHVLISPTKGVFVLETKSHRGRVTLADDGKGLLVNGRAPEKDFVKQCHRNLFWVRDRVQDAIGIEHCEPWITTAIVFPNAFVEVRKPIRGVEIINARYLAMFLARCPERRDSEAIWARRGELGREFAIVCSSR